MQEEIPARLLARVPEGSKRSCICVRCIREEQRAVAKTRPLPKPQPGDFYIEKENIVFTEAYHRRRGYCCGSGCRHCPFDLIDRALAGLEPPE